MKRTLCLICLIFVITVMLFETLFYRSLEYKALPKETSQITFRGELLDIDKINDKSVLYLKNKKENLCCICYLAEDFSNVKQLKIGNILNIEGKVRYFEKATNDGQFDIKKYYAVKGIDFSMQDCSYTLEVCSYSVFRHSLYLLKQKIGMLLDTGLPERDAGVLKAMLLGDKGDMNPDIKGLYQRNGIAHIIAVSGLHITLLGMGFCRMLRKIYIPLPMANVLAFFFVVCYGQLTGSQASSVRSIIMFSLYLLAQILHKTYDLLTSMMLSATILLCVQPLYASYGGFLLSFFAVAGLSVVLPWLNDIFFQKGLVDRIVYTDSKKEKIIQKIKSFVIASFMASLSVAIVSLPIQILLFHTYSVYSVLINILIAPLIGILLFLGVMGVIFIWHFPALGEILFFLCHVILFLFEKICTTFDTLWFAHPIIAEPSEIKIGVYYVVLILLLLGTRIELSGTRKKNGLYKGVIAGILLLNSIFLCIHARFSNKLYMMDVGQGDCFVVEEKGGMTFLVDGGSSSVSEVGKRRMISFLKSHGIGQVDYVFLSHADKDHTDGVLEMLKTPAYDAVKIKYLVLTKYAKGNELYEELIEAADKAGTKVMYIASDFSLQSGDCEIRCIYPSKQLEDDVIDENDRSMMLQIKIGSTDILFTGDLTQCIEEELIADHVLKGYCADILKVGHHGSKYSSSDAFLQQIKPKLSLISAGRSNRYGHPHEETIERIEDVGSNWITTSEMGMCEVHFDKKGFSVFCPYADDSNE